jgi:cytochrome P450
LNYILRPILRSQILLHVSGDLGRRTLSFLRHTRLQLQERLLKSADKLYQNRKDFLYYMLEAKDSETGKGFTRQDLDAESGLLISAGADTVSTALTATIFYLVNNSEALKKATAEVRNKFSQAEAVRGVNLHTELPYLTACVDESLRLSPPVPSQMHREVLNGGITVDGKYIPQGTLVGVSPYVIHHNPEYYPEPFAFLPERWSADSEIGNSKESLAKAKSAFCPFSLGARGCIGKRVAYIELLGALGTLLHTYDLRLPEKEKQIGGGDPASKIQGRNRPDEYQLVDKFLADRDGPMIEFKERC